MGGKKTKEASESGHGDRRHRFRKWLNKLMALSISILKASSSAAPVVSVTPKVTRTSPMTKEAETVISSIAAIPVTSTKPIAKDENPKESVPASTSVAVTRAGSKADQTQPIMEVEHAVSSVLAAAGVTTV